MGTERRGRRLTRWLARAALGLLAVPALSAQATDSLSRPSSHRMGWGRETFVLTEVLEYHAASAGRPALFDLVAWSGGVDRRVWFKADGSAATVGSATHGEYQLLYGWLLTPWWDLQVGVRADLRTGAGGAASRGGVAFGLQGLAPGWFELEPSVFVTTLGNVALDFTASYDLFLTQRLVLQPRLEASAALRDEAEFGVGRGVSNATLGLRTRYELRREFAPYLGVVWERGFGRSAELARLAGEPTRQVLLVAGLRLWR